MGKQKVRQSAVKRFKVTKTGKVMFSHQYSSHLKIHKSGSRLRRQKEPGEMTGVNARNIKRMLGK